MLSINLKKKVLFFGLSITVGVSFSILGILKYSHWKKEKNQFIQEIDKLTKKAEESIENLSLLSQQKFESTQKLIQASKKDINWNNVSETEVELLKSPDLKTENQFRKWEKGLSQLNSQIAEELIKLLENKKTLSNDWIKDLQEQDKKLDQALITYHEILSARNQLIDKLNKNPLNQIKTYSRFPTSLVYQINPHLTQNR